MVCTNYVDCTGKCFISCRVDTILISCNTTLPICLLGIPHTLDGCNEKHCPLCRAPSQLLKPLKKTKIKENLAQMQFLPIHYFSGV